MRYNFTFCLRPISQTIFRNIYPQSPLRRNIGNDWQRISLMEISSLRGSPEAALIACFYDWTEVSLSSCVSLPLKSCFSLEAAYFSLSLSRSWRMASVADDFLTARRINVFPMLYIQFSSFLKGIIVAWHAKCKKVTSKVQNFWHAKCKKTI